MPDPITDDVTDDNGEFPPNIVSAVVRNSVGKKILLTQVIFARHNGHVSHLWTKRNVKMNKLNSFWSDTEILSRQKFYSLFCAWIARRDVSAGCETCVDLTVHTNATRDCFRYTFGHLFLHFVQCLVRRCGTCGAIQFSWQNIDGLIFVSCLQCARYVDAFGMQHTSSMIVYFTVCSLYIEYVQSAQFCVHIEHGSNRSLRKFKCERNVINNTID